MTTDPAPPPDHPLATVETARRRILDEGRPEAVEKQHGRGRLTARERIALLCDESSFRELGSLASPVQEHEWNAGLTAPADGIVAGVGRIEGRPVAVTAHDFTVLGGSIGVVGSAKNNRTITLATERGLPLVMALEGGGHRIQDGQNSRHFAAGSVVFQHLARNSGWTPMAMAILGSGFAGPTNYCSLADFVVMVRGASWMGMAGPALVKAGTGEDVDQETLGGARRQVDEHGLADLAVESEAEALAAIRRFLSYLPSNARAPLPIVPSGDPKDRREEALLEVVPADQRRVYDVREVIRLIADRDDAAGSSVFELKPRWARNVVTAFARLDGRPVGFLANQPRHLAGMLDARGVEKAARFVGLCDAFGLPLVTLIDVPGFAIGSGAERSGLGRRSGRLFYEMGIATVPRISVVLRKGYGSGYIAMGGGRSFEADLALAWPTAEICAMSVEGSVDVAYRRRYEGAEDPAAARAALIAEIRQNLGPVQAGEGFGIDEVIDPRDTRAILIETLASCPPRRPDRGPPRYRPISPI